MQISNINIITNINPVSQLAPFALNRININCNQMTTYNFCNSYQQNSIHLFNTSKQEGLKYHW